MFHPPDHFCGPPGPTPTGPCPAYAEGSGAGRRTPGQSREAESPPSTCWPRFFRYSQGFLGFLGCKHVFSAHVQLFIHQYPQVLLSRTALNPFIPQPLVILRVALTQVQDLALGLVEPQEVHMGPLLKLVQVTVDGILSVRCVNGPLSLVSSWAYRLMFWIWTKYICKVGRYPKSRWNFCCVHQCDLLMDYKSVQCSVAFSFSVGQKEEVAWGHRVHNTFTLYWGNYVRHVFNFFIGTILLFISGHASTSLPALCVPYSQASPTWLSMKAEKKTMLRSEHCSFSALWIKIIV